MDVTVSEGTSMSVAVSPDGRTLAVDLQGSIWTMPADRRRDDADHRLFDDARQPTWSPDGTSITFFAYRDGGYDLWSIAPDGTQAAAVSRRGRSTIASRSGRTTARRLAFSSDRGGTQPGGDYNIWILDVRDGALRQVTTHAAEDFMPSWSPDDREIVFASTRENGAGLWAADVASGSERKVATAAGRLDAPSWGPAGSCVYHDTVPGESRYEVDGKPLTGNENVFAFRASWSSPTEFYYVSDGKIRKRTLGGTAQTVAVHRHVAGEAAAVHAAAARLRFDGAAAGGGHRPAGDLAGRHEGGVCGRRRHLRDGRSAASRRTSRRIGSSTPIRRGRPTAASSPTRPTAAATCCRSGFAT